MNDGVISRTRARQRDEIERSAEQPNSIEASSWPDSSSRNARASTRGRWRWLTIYDALERDLLWAIARSTDGEAGEIGRAVEALRRLLALDPLDEQAHRELMVLHHEHGDRTAARLQYERCVSLIQHELGRLPEEATSELLHEIERAPQVATRSNRKSASALLPHHEIRYVSILIAGPGPVATIRSLLSKIASSFDATVHPGIGDHTVALIRHVAHARRRS